MADDVTFGKKLGEGMSAEVFLATYRGKEVAIKKIFFTSPDDDAIVDFHKEAKLMRQLKHQFIITMLGCSVARPFAYIVTEFMHKGSMYDMYTGDYNNNPPPWKVRVVCHVSESILGAIIYSVFSLTHFLYAAAYGSAHCKRPCLPALTGGDAP